MIFLPIPPSFDNSRKRRLKTLIPEEWPKVILLRKKSFIHSCSKSRNLESHRSFSFKEDSIYSLFIFFPLFPWQRSLDIGKLQELWNWFPSPFYDGNQTHCNYCQNGKYFTYITTPWPFIRAGYRLQAGVKIEPLKLGRSRIEIAKLNF